jgi:lipoprotein-releasing system ATP-binding protein
VTAPLVEARGATRVLPGPVPVTLVEDIDLAIDAGEFVAITGPSGSGKSSLLYLLGLLDLPSAGAILLDGADTTGLEAATLAALRLEKIGFVFQFHFLLPEFTALGNVMLPLRKRGGRDAAAIRERAAARLAELGLSAVAGKRPSQLSGGQRQRVAIARALANDPQLILADEPTGNLDTVNAALVFDIFARLVREEGRTVVAVTHDPALAGRADRQVRIVDGRLVAP